MIRRTVVTIWYSSYVLFTLADFVADNVADVFMSADMSPTQKMSAALPVSFCHRQSRQLWMNSTLCEIVLLSLTFNVKLHDCCWWHTTFYLMAINDWQVNAEVSHMRKKSRNSTGLLLSSLPLPLWSSSCHKIAPVHYSTGMVMG